MWTVVAMEYGYDLDQEQRQRNLPRLIEANYLLHLSSQELETVISAEMTSNPALEIDELPACPICGTTLERGACPTCLVDHTAPAQAAPDEENDRFDVLPSQPSSDEEFDAVSLIAGDYNVLGQLLSDAHAALEKRDHCIAETIISAIDDRGFLTSDLREIAQICGNTLED